MSPLSASPSEFIGQSLTNMFQPATQQLAQTLQGGSSIKQQARPLALAAPSTSASTFTQNDLSSSNSLGNFLF